MTCSYRDLVLNSQQQGDLPKADHSFSGVAIAGTEIYRTKQKFPLSARARHFPYRHKSFPKSPR